MLSFGEPEYKVGLDLRGHLARVAAVAARGGGRPHSQEGRCSCCVHNGGRDIVSRPKFVFLFYTKLALLREKGFAVTAGSASASLGRCAGVGIYG